MASLTDAAAKEHRLLDTEIHMREKAGGFEDDAALYQAHQSSRTAIGTFVGQLGDAERSGLYTARGLASHRQMLAEPLLLAADRFDGQAAVAERHQATTEAAAWSAELAIPPSSHNNVLDALQLLEARRDLASLADVRQDELLRRSDETGTLARKAAYGLPGLRGTAWGLPTTAQAARAAVIARADVGAAHARARELRGLARRLRRAAGVDEAPLGLGR